MDTGSQDELQDLIKNLDKTPEEDPVVSEDKDRKILTLKSGIELDITEDEKELEENFKHGEDAFEEWVNTD